MKIFNFLRLRRTIFNTKKGAAGSVLVYNLIVIFIFSLVMVAVLGYAVIQLRVIRGSVNREMAFQIAEAGANYYQWHLAHFSSDFWDGNASTTPGPYIHDYIDRDTNQKVGEFSLQITPPLPGSTIVTIKSTGFTTDYPAQKRSVSVRYGKPSLAKYAFLTNSYVLVGSTSVFYGQFHSNSGIQFNGTANSPVTSFRTTYTCQDGDGCSGTYPGIWGSAASSTQAFWDFPVLHVDYTGITSDFEDLETLATGQADLPPSNEQGYSLVFNPDGTVSVYKVTALRAHNTGYDVNGQWHSEDLDYQTRDFQYTMPIPSNGVIFVRDHVWVEGVVNGRVVVAATKYSTDPAQQARILIPNNITYLAKDGNHVLGLIAEKDLLLTYYVPDDLEIDAAFIAQNGAFQRYCFSDTPKDTLTVYGSISSFSRPYVYCSGYNSGYTIRNYIYDSSLLYGPPPSFPLSNEGYQQISWESN